MKKILKALLISIFILAVLSFTASAAKISVNGVVKELPAYNIKDNNYFKLRDVAIILNGTEAQFDVQWNEFSQSINLVSNTPYSGTESINTDVVQGAVARSSNAYMTRDGKTVALKAYNINFNNYFKLRDLGALFNFNVTWDENAGLIGIDTKAPYEYPEYNGTDFALNTKHLSLIGKNKGEIDAMCGTPEHFSDTMYTYTDYYTYPCGVIVNYGLFSNHTEKSGIQSLKIKLSDMFYNCPETVTAKQVQSLFVETEYLYDVLNINYCGVRIIIRFENGVAKSDTYAEINQLSQSGAFISNITEVVYVGAEWANKIEKSESRFAFDYISENLKEIKVPDGGTYSYNEVGFALIDVSGDGVKELLVEVYEPKFDREYRAIYVKKGDKFVYAMGGLYFSVVYSYKDSKYYLWELEEVSNDEYYKNTQKYYSWDGTNKNLVLEVVSEYDNNKGTNNLFYNGVSYDRYSEEIQEYYREFGMYYQVFTVDYTRLLNADFD